MNDLNSEALVLVERPSEHVAVVILNRPERMNSMAFDVIVPLRQALADLTRDNDVRAVVLTGAGSGFSSGADHKSAGSVPHVGGLTRPTFALRSMEVLDDVILAIRRMHQPVIAAVQRGGHRRRTVSSAGVRHSGCFAARLLSGGGHQQRSHGE